MSRLELLEATVFAFRGVLSTGLEARVIALTLALDTELYVERIFRHGALFLQPHTV